MAHSRPTGLRPFACCDRMADIKISISGAVSLLTCCELRHQKHKGQPRGAPLHVSSAPPRLCFKAHGLEDVRRGGNSLRRAPVFLSRQSRTQEMNDTYNGQLWNKKNKERLACSCCRCCYCSRIPQPRTEWRVLFRVERDRRSRASVSVGVSASVRCVGFPNASRTTNDRV